MPYLPPLLPPSAPEPPPGPDGPVGGAGRPVPPVAAEDEAPRDTIPCPPPGECPDAATLAALSAAFAPGRD